MNGIMETKNLLVCYYLWRKSRTKQKTKKTTSKKRRFWAREIFRLRNTVGAGSSLVKEMRLNPNNRHSNFFRMSPETFDRLLVLVGPHISKSDLGREPISPGTRLAITLRYRYLASGDSMTSMSYLFRVGISTVSNILSETLPAIWNALQPLVLVPPDAEGWKKIANGFEHKWNFPNCIGGIDGKHVTIQAPPHAGSSYYNYKGRHSLVFMAVVDHVYRFILVDIGAQGRQSDGGIFRNSVIGHKLMNKSLAIPPPQVVSEGRLPLPFVMVGDAAFPLLENVLTPYPGNTDIDEKIYNYRHSRARRVSENAFGILVARWWIFSRAIIAKVENVDNIIKAAVCLHNFVICYDKQNSSYITPTLVDHEQDGVLTPGIWRAADSQLTSVRKTGSNMSTRNARDRRDQFKDYFNEEGAVPWQWNIL